MKMHNIEIERTILSSIIYNPNIYDEIIVLLEDEDFFHPFHKKVFQTIKELKQENKAIDEAFVKEKLKIKKQFHKDMFLDILATNPMSNPIPYVNEIKEKSLKRKIFKMALDVESLVKKDLSSIDIIDNIQSKLYKTIRKKNHKDFKNSAEIIENTLKYIKKAKEKNDDILVGLDTGFYSLNLKTAGFNKGDLIIIAARPSMGKTAFSLNIAQNVLDNNKGVAIFSLEMPSKQIVMRMLSIKTEIPLAKIRTGNLTEDELEKIKKEAENLSNKKFFIYDSGSINIQQLKSRLKKIKTTHNDIELVIIDYLQLMNSTQEKRYRHLEVSEISRELKLLARELDLPIIALSQLNRTLENRTDKRPMLSDLRESGAIEQDADLILFIYREDVYKAKEAKEKIKKLMRKGIEDKEMLENLNFNNKEKEVAEIIIGKQRNGSIGSIAMLFDKKCVKFTEYNKENQNDSNINVEEYVYDEKDAENETKEEGLSSLYDDIPQIDFWET